MMSKIKSEKSNQENIDPSSNEGGRKIKLDIRNPDSQFMMMLVGPEVKKIRDLVNKVKHLVPEMRDLDIKVYQTKYLLPPVEDISIINTEEDVIISPRVRDVVIKNEIVEEDVKPVMTEHQKKKFVYSFNKESGKKRHNSTQEKVGDLKRTKISNLRPEQMREDWKYHHPTGTAVCHSPSVCHSFSLTDCLPHLVPQFQG